MGEFDILSKSCSKITILKINSRGALQPLFEIRRNGSINTLDTEEQFCISAEFEPTLTVQEEE